MHDRHARSPASPPQRRRAPRRAADGGERGLRRAGYHGASLEEIAQTAGVSKALIYEHFASKRELHAELVDAHATEIFRRLQANAETGDDRRGAAARRHRRVPLVRRGAPRRVEALFRDASDPEVAEAIAGVQQQAVGVIAELMASDPDIREDPERDPGQRALTLEAYAQLLAGSIQALGNWWHDHQHVPREVVLDRAMEFCWLGMDRVSEGAHLGRRRTARGA